MKWFSVVKDGNPKEYGRYLTACKFINIPQIRIYDGIWDSLTEVTHWMELPEMPNR